jgi:hypothetical protein
MTYRTLIDAKTASTDLSAVFDFARDITGGEVINSASTTATVYSGTDPTPSAVTLGPPTIFGRQTIQILTGGVLGVTYNIVCTIVTSLGQTLIREGYLVVVPDSI